MKRYIAGIMGLGVTAWASMVMADSTDAACEIYPAGADRSDLTVSCRFYQAQGRVVITRADGVEYDFTMQGDTPGNFVDEQGRTVYRQGDLGDQGLIFRLPDESVYVYWNTAMLEPADESNPTWPFTTDYYDATALFRCRLAGAEQFSECPGGILRMGGGEASIVVQSPSGEQFTINVMRDYVNAANREVDARLKGDTWMLTFANGEVWEIPLAAVEGG
ncbi:conserved hypothetical protein [gamma proteobacterium NOR5-3]|nr:conserved hypothetical protein [gamma proteobacterium NOR5-3]